jgi:uncharacterized protein (TIGR02265 family)
MAAAGCATGLGNMDMRPFVDINLNAPFDRGALLAVIPAEPMLKGMFFQNLRDRCVKAGVVPVGALPSYVAFRDYSIRQYAELMVNTAVGCFPHLSVRRALYEIGRNQFDVFATSMVGKVMLAGFFAGSPARMAKVVAKIYQVVHSHARVEVLESSAEHIVLRYTDLWCFLDCNEVGTLIGAVEAFGYQGEAKISVRGPASADVMVRWRPR